jgi:hypothetical protein
MSSTISISNRTSMRTIERGTRAPTSSSLSNSNNNSRLFKQKNSLSPKKITFSNNSAATTDTRQRHEAKSPFGSESNSSESSLSLSQSPPPSNEKMRMTNNLTVSKQQLNSYALKSVIEKTEMGELNTKMKNYLIRVRELELENQEWLNAINDIQDQWCDGTKQVKSDYEGPLIDMRTIVDDACSSKSNAEVKVKRLVNDLADLRAKYERELKVKSPILLKEQKITLKF